MNRLLLLPVLALAAGLASTAPSFAGLKEDYMAACLKASGENSVLCTCKAAEAPKYADDEMLGFIILNMRDSAKFTAMVSKGEVPETVTKKWPIYVMKSNLACKTDN